MKVLLHFLKTFSEKFFTWGNKCAYFRIKMLKTYLHIKLKDIQWNYQIGKER